MMNTKEFYTQLDHTADIGIEVRGDDFTSLMEYAAFALFDIITDIRKVNPTNRIEINISANREEEMMRGWLEDLLFNFNVNNALFCKFKVTALGDQHLRGEAWGEVFDSTRHLIHTEIKGITYHQFEVSHSKDGWYSKIIFDV